MFCIKGNKLKMTQTFPYPPEAKFKLSALIFRGILCLHSGKAVNEPQVEMPFRKRHPRRRIITE